MAALEDVDRVQLQHTQTVQRRIQLADADAGRLRPPEALRGERYATSLRGADALPGMLLDHTHERTDDRRRPGRAPPGLGLRDRQSRERGDALQDVVVRVLGELRPC